MPWSARLLYDFMIQLDELELKVEKEIGDFYDLLPDQQSAETWLYRRQ